MIWPGRRDPGTGRLTANFDGVRYSVYIERVKSEERDEHD